MRAANLHRLARTLREVALLATKNTGDDRVDAGELAVLEDIARNPGSTISDITRRTGLAQSLVSRITHGMADGGARTASNRIVRRSRIPATANSSVNLCAALPSTSSATTCKPRNSLAGLPEKTPAAPGRSRTPDDHSPAGTNTSRGPVSGPAITS